MQVIPLYGHTACMVLFWTVYIEGSFGVFFTTYTVFSLLNAISRSKVVKVFLRKTILSKTVQISN